MQNLNLKRNDRNIKGVLLGVWKDRDRGRAKIKVWGVNITEVPYIHV
jgi:hypothetical protein